MTGEVYLREAERSLERLLSNMDRNRGSHTFGCLSRPYWHDKVTDFPSAHQQIGVFPLAIAYTHEWEGNPYYRNDEIKELLDASLNFWSDIQKSDGSFDEHYPNEHSLGAAAWSLWAVTEACLLLEDYPDIEDSIEKAVKFLRENDEPGDIANHQAVTASALLNAHRLIDTGKEGIEGRMDVLEDMQSEHGWFREYRGADIGYQSTTISHVARIWEYDSQLVSRRMIEDALDFFSNFIDRHNYYAGFIGSRNTDHIHSTGFEILSEEFEQADRISNAVRQNRKKGNLLEPLVMDDKHFTRQLAEYLDSWRYADESRDSLPEPIEQDYGCIEIMKSGDTVTYLNKSKGGVYRRFSRGDILEEDRGISVGKRGKIYTSNWPDSSDKIQRKEGCIEIEGRMREVPRNTMEGWRFIASRLFSYTLGNSKWMSLKAKDILISLLIDADSDGPHFKRRIETGSEWEVEDSFEGERINGKVRKNFVPSSEFFSLER